MTPKETEEKAIEKIQKLLALQQSAEKVGSIQEAANAAEKVQRLLLKHNLSMDSLNLQDKAPVKGLYMDLEKIFDYDKRQGLWVFSMIGVVSKFYLCRVIFLKVSGSNQPPQVVFIGRDDNVQTAIGASLNMASQIRYLEKIAYKKSGQVEPRGSFRRAYYGGVVIGLAHAIARIEQLRKEAQVVEVEPGVNLPMVIVGQLIKQTESENQDFISKRFGDDIKHKSGGKVREDSAGTFMGYRDGLKLNPQTSIGN